MIRSVSVKNIFALRDIEMDFEQFTVIVGPNGCGKTTLLRVLASQSMNFGDGTAAIEFSEPQGWISLLSLGTGSRSGVVGQSLFLALSAPYLRIANHLGQVLEENGQGLGAIVARVRLEMNDGPKMLADRLGKIIPGVVNVGVDTDQSHRVMPFVEFAGVGKVAAERLSEGTLFALAVVAVLSQPNPPDILLIDDLDKGLHPAAFSELVAVLRAALVANPGLQIIATTHSPDLLGCFGIEEVRVMARKPDGSAVCRKLSDHPEADHWNDVLDPGEFWASVGEEWVLPK